MIIKVKGLISNIEINSLEDLRTLGLLQEATGIKVNKSAIARQLAIDRRTVDKYINGYQKSVHRNKGSKIDAFESIIRQLLNDKEKIFNYKSFLYHYLVDNYQLDCAQSSFRRYISQHEEFNNYFKNQRCYHPGGRALVRYETSAGEQAQIDWKESMKFVLKSGEVITINIFVFILSYSRYRIYKLSLEKTQDILFNFLDEAFTIIGGVPKEILNDNMKTVMDQPRTPYSQGKINDKYQQFANDYGFKVHPCIAGRPETKGKVESPMRILDELKAYSGDLDYIELNNKLEALNNRENARYHASYQTVPIMALKQEKSFLLDLPQSKIRSYYQINTESLHVNKMSMITYKTNQYSVPHKYIGKIVKIQVYDNQIHVYYKDQLIALHDVSDQKINYTFEHYKESLGNTLKFDDDKITKIAKENLEKIGAASKHDNNI